MGFCKAIIWWIEDKQWSVRCNFNLWLHGPYGLAKVIEKIPFRFLIKYLRRYGAEIGENCRFERGINLHRALGGKPFENLVIGNNVYLGHKTLIDLSGEVIIKDKVIVASGCQIWTHSSFYEKGNIEGPQYGEHFGNVIIEQGAIIYSGVIISPGLNIGKFAAVGANSLVNKDVEANTFVGGVPAKFIKSNLLI